MPNSLAPKSYEEAKAKRQIADARRRAKPRKPFRKRGDMSGTLSLDVYGLRKGKGLQRASNALSGDSAQSSRTVRGNGQVSRKPRKPISRGRGFRRKPLTETQKADAEFSLMIREAASWICARCGRDHSENHAGLEASHFWNVRYYAVRYDPDNVIPLCGRFSNPNCHTGPDGWEYAKDDLQAYQIFMVKELGAAKFVQLKEKARSHIKLRDAIAEFRQSMLKE